MEGICSPLLECMYIRWACQLFHTPSITALLSSVLPLRLCKCVYNQVRTKQKKALEILSFFSKDSDNSCQGYSVILFFLMTSYDYMKILRGTNFCINVVWLRDTQISRLLRLTVGTSSFLSLVFPPTPPIIGGSEETDKIIIIYLNQKFRSFSIGPSSLLQDIQNELRSLTSSLFIL